MADDGTRTTILAVVPTSEYPTSSCLDRLAHEFELRNELDGNWAVRPLEVVREHGRTMLVLEDLGGEPLARLLGSALEMGRFLRLAVGISATLGKVHQRALIHKDIKPANIIVGGEDGHVRLTGFGIASRLLRERQAPEPPEAIAGTLAYMAPEQTGRMNRSVDARSDLYALGVTFYQMLTGSLPFSASEPLEWVHCHIARKPIPAAERVKEIPGPVSAIVMKLLAKTAEERYQTAAGLEHDLKRCLADWEARGSIGAFALAERDTPDRLLIPEKLYGRESEIATLLAALDRVVESGAPELVLVSGYSGIGKSSVVNELHKVLVPPRGLFASGKFDQYKRDIPYATLAQAFQSLVRWILGQDDAELGRWRQALLEALGPNGQLIVNLIPELALIIGDQPPVPELPPQDAQNRFQMVFRRFLAVFARPEQPLTLFIDDLQWLDAATLDLLTRLVVEWEVQNLLLIGAYRDNEVGSSHPLARSLARIRQAGGRVNEIVLTALSSEDVGRLISATLHAAPDRVQPLTALVFEKTAGNPFFAIQFIIALAQEGLLAFDPEQSSWRWDMDRIRAKGFTDNVADLMAQQLGRLPERTQKALGMFACLGSTAETTTLDLVQEGTNDARSALREAVTAGLVFLQGSTWRFIHDRVQEAAYALIRESDRAAMHLRIGRLLASRTRPEELEASIFDIVNQLNRGAALITTREERERAAKLNLLAGKRAKAATAYASALQYFSTGRDLLGEQAWEWSYRDTFDLELNWGECAYLTGELEQADARLAALSARAHTAIDLAAVTSVCLNLCMDLGEIGRAVEVGLGYLRRVDERWPLRATAEDVRREYERIWLLLGHRPIESLRDLPLLADAELQALMDFLAVFTTPAFFTDENLFQLVVCRMVTLSLEQGNSDGSSLAYVWLGSILGKYFADYRKGLRVAQFGLDLAEQQGLRRFRARVYLVFAVHVANWTQPLSTGRTLIQRAFEVAQETGDVSFVAYSRIDLITNLLASGDPLIEIERTAEDGLEIVQKLRVGPVRKGIQEQLRIIQALRGLPIDIDMIALPDNARLDRLHRVSKTIGAIRELQWRVFMRDYAGAVAAASGGAPLWAVPTQFELAEYHFYGALAHSGCSDTASPEEQRRHLEAVEAHHRQIVSWAENCPATFTSRAALVGAELARLQGRDLDAERLYEEAIHSAREHGFIQNEAIANEFAARFHATRGFRTISGAYLQNARACYLRWGADGKVQQLDEMHPRVRTEEPIFAPTSTIATPVEHLDLATVIKVSQAVSGEIVLEKLLETLMRTAIEQAGAERGLLILSHGVEQRIAAEATTTGDVVNVRLCDEPVAPTMLPESVLHYVLRARESVILDDISDQSPFAADPYIRQQVRSVLCLPLLNQAKVIGVLYLENNLARRVFAPARIAVLKLIASQAAVSLENTRLYRDLAEREARIRRLVDANIIGICIWQLDGQLFEANDAFLQMIGYPREDLIAGRIRWTDLTAPEWRERDARLIQDFKRTGTLPPFEKEYLRKDGSRVPVLIGVAGFGESESQGVSFVLDLTERKRAEAEARESERRYREVQQEMAHVNRVATMGQLTASIAHEVNQPIAAVVTNAQAALRWLQIQPLDLKEIKESLGRIENDGKRAGNVIHGMRALIKKAPPKQEYLDVNEALADVVVFTRDEAVKNGVLVRTQLGDDLPIIRGDRVQLQQVMLNLIINAIEAMSEVNERSRELQISTCKDSSNGILVSVADSGPGLAPATFERAFEAFYTTKPDGVGVGLSICRSIVEMHGGRLWATANVPHGAIFQFTLPAQEQDHR